MLNFRKIAASSKGRLLLRYFTEDTPEPIHPPAIDAQGRRLEDGGRLTAYYTGRDSRATWRPDMPAILAKAIGINPRAIPRDVELSRLFEARRADNGEAWSRHTRKLSGFDLVFSPHKSISLAAEFAATPAESALICNAVDRANDRAMRHVAQVLGWARKGAGGEAGADPGAVGWVTFRHHTARPTLHIQDGRGGETYLVDAPVAGDPHLHLHNFLMNLVVTADGRVGSLDTRALTDARVKEFGAYFQAVLADELRRLGVRIGYDAKKEAVVVLAVPEEVSAVFSKRDKQILQKAKAFAKSRGLDWNDISADRKFDIVHEASADGRLGKMKNDERRIWREQAVALGWQHNTVLEGAEHEHLTDAERFDRAYEFAARYLADEFHTAAVISHEKLGMYAARGLISTGVAGGPDDIKRVVELLEERGIRFKGEHVALVIGIFDDKVRVSNTAQIRIEEKLAALAWESGRDRSGALSVAALRQAMARSGIDFTAEQRAAVHALDEGGGLTMLTGVAGSGKTTLLQPLVAAWKADMTYSGQGRDVLGAATAWRQADALQDAGIDRTYALQPLLRMIDAGEFQPTHNTVLVVDEVSQIGPRPMLKLLELQARTGMTIKMLGDREQAQAIEAGDSIEILRRALPPEAVPELLSTIRQATARSREIAGLFREGDAEAALARKRADGHAVTAGGDREQVVGRIADLYISRRDVLVASGGKRGITVTAPTNDDAAEISQAIRARLRDRGEIGADEQSFRAIDQRGTTYDLPIAVGDRLRLYRRTWGKIDGRNREIGSNGDIVEVLGQDARGLRLRNRHGDIADVEWRRLKDQATGRLFLGLGHALTIDAAQGITSDEHINALPRGTSGVTAFTTYVAESRSRGTTWTVISEAAVHEAERHQRARRGKHDPDAVLRAVRSVHRDVPVVGGAAAGVISREGFGYSGFEIGIAGWHTPDTTPQFYSTDALYESDHEGGRRLGRMARDNGAHAAPILLFYDSVRSYEPRQLHVAGSVVAGFREGWGDGAPNLVGGGVLTDLNLTDGWILTGDAVKRHAALALVFPEAFKVETQILRACRPVSAYMNITQKKGAEIYALDGRPALDVIEERLDQPLIGADGHPTRIMTLGQKIGDPFEHGTPDDYVNRLIITADLERRSITLFEPDFAEGSQVQLMINDNEVMLESARRGAATARSLGTLKPRVRPMLRLYIDCAGRASVVTGAQPEEATVVLQELASDDVPFLGFYSGVEIAPVRGDPRPLDWTGVLTTLLEVTRRG